jgi:hypothetical protein
MQRRHGNMRRLLSAILAGLLLSGALSGCGVLRDEFESRDGTVDYGDVAEAVTAAVPRVVAVRDLSRWLNGFAYAMSLGLEVDSAEPFTADELDAVVEAIWRTVPWEPNTIKITAGAAEGDEIVDLRAAAEELEPLNVTEAGQAGVTLTGMDARYGDWTAPE